MNKENFTSSFLGCMLLISFFPYCAGWNLHCRVHRCGQSRHPGLFLGLQGRALRFSLLSVTLAVESLWLPFTTVSECSNGKPNLHSWDVPHLIVYHWIYWKIGKVSVREGYQSVASLPRVPLCGFSMVSWLHSWFIHFLVGGRSGGHSAIINNATMSILEQVLFVHIRFYFFGVNI